MTGITPDATDLEAAFAVEIFDMLKKEGKIGRIVIDNMNRWEHNEYSDDSQNQHPYEDEYSQLNHASIKFPFIFFLI